MMRLSTKSLFATGFLLCFLHAAVASSASPRPVVNRAVAFGLTPPLSQIVQTSRLSAAATKLRIVQLGEPGGGAGGNHGIDPVRQSGMGAVAMPAPLLTFEGIKVGDNATVGLQLVAPPDPNGAIGPNHYVQWGNSVFRVFDRTGLPLTPPMKVSSLFASVPGVCATTDSGDGIVLYDAQADRWLISQFAFADEFNGPYYQSIAVSQTSNPTGSYYVYCFQMPDSGLNDYPKFGVWPDGYYMTDNQFPGALFFGGAGVFAFDRAKMLAGDPTAAYIYFNVGDIDPNLGSLLPATVDGAPPPAGSPNLMFTLDGTDLHIFEFHADFTDTNNATFTELPESPLTVAPYAASITGITQPPGDGTELDPINDRLMYRAQYRNFGAVETIVLNHTVDAGAVAGIRYYQLRRAGPGGEFFIYDQSTFAPADGNNRWMGSAALDGSGNFAIGYSISGPSQHPSLAYAGKLAGDPPGGGLSQGEQIMFAGPGSQTGGLDRWGDYSSLMIDPVNDCTFWFTHEYIPSDGSFNWRTRVGAFRFVSCTGGGLTPVQFAGAILTGGNGNGIIDPNECNLLQLIVTNTSSLDITGPVRMVLSSLTGGVFVAPTNSFFGLVPANGTATSDVPYAVSSSIGFACGTPVVFNALLKGGSIGLAVISFQLPTSSILSAPSRFDNNTAVAIPDQGTVDSPLTVTGLAGNIGLATVSLYLNHTFDADLTLALIAPDGTAVALSRGNGGAGQGYGTNCADNARTTFADAAASTIITGTPPYVGTFQSEVPLSTLNGLSPNGTWVLRVSDQLPFDTGTLNCWSLTLSTAVCTNGSGPCVPSPLVCVTPTVDFGPHQVGSLTPTIPLILTNCGTEDLTITNLVLTGANAADFAIVSDACSGATLSSGGTCVIGLVFAPTLVSAETATLQINDNAPDSPQFVTLIGSGVQCSGIAVGPTSLPTPRVGLAYTNQLTASGTTGAALFLRTAGTYPPGLVLSTNGLVAGVPTTPGTYSFKVTVTDDVGCTGERYYTLTVLCAVVGASPQNLPIGQVGVPYQQQLLGTGGVPPYSFGVAGGSLPQGLTLSANGLLSGTPTLIGSAFVVAVTDSNGCHGTQPYILVVAIPPPALLPLDVPVVVAGQASSQLIQVSGGATPYSFALTGGTLPAGVSLSGDGLLAGSPTTTGSASFGVRVTDAQGRSASRTYTLTVNCPSIAVNPTTLPAGQVNGIYQQTLHAAGGVGRYKFTCAGGLPDGLTLSPDGVLSGAPVNAGTATFSVTVADTNNCTASQNFTVSILPQVVATAADLRVSASCQAAAPVLGNLTCTVTVSNAGPAAATNVVLRVPVPAVCQLVSITTSQGACVQTAGTVTCVLGTLAPGDTVQATVVTVVTKAGNFLNTVQANADQADPNTGNNTAVIGGNIVAEANVDLTGEGGSVRQKCRAAGRTPAWCQLRGWFTIRNQGGQLAPATAVRFVLSPSGVLTGDEPLLAQVPVRALKAGAHRRVSLNVRVPAVSSLSGQTVIAIIDPSAALAETDKGNNVVVVGVVP